MGQQDIGDLIIGNYYYFVFISGDVEIERMITKDFPRTYGESYIYVGVSEIYDLCRDHKTIYSFDTLQDDIHLLRINREFRLILNSEYLPLQFNRRGYLENYNFSDRRSNLYIFNNPSLIVKIYNI